MLNQLPAGANVLPAANADGTLKHAAIVPRQMYVHLFIISVAPSDSRSG
jgi:hypothetical protein